MSDNMKDVQCGILPSAHVCYFRPWSHGLLMTTVDLCNVKFNKYYKYYMTHCFPSLWLYGYFTCLRYDLDFPLPIWALSSMCVTHLYVLVWIVRYNIYVKDSKRMIYIHKLFGLTWSASWINQRVLKRQ